MLFPNGNTPVKITLYNNVPFDNKYEHHLFRDVEFIYAGKTYTPIKMKNFLDARGLLNVYQFSRQTLTGSYNFNYGNGLVTSIVLAVLPQFTSANYMYVESGGDEFYFFITDAFIKNSFGENEVTVEFSLELDVLATYGKTFFDLIKDVPVFTERKHCQRFAVRSNENEKVKFYCSDLVNSEDVTINCKPNIIKEVKEHNQDLDNGTLNTNLLWVYITCENVELKLPTDVGTIPPLYAKLPSSKITDINNPVSVIALPLCDEFVIKIDDKTYVTKVKELLTKLYDEPKVYQVKMSPNPPFNSLLTVGYNNKITKTTENGTFKVTLEIVNGSYETILENFIYAVTLNKNKFVVVNSELDFTIEDRLSLLMVDNQKETNLDYILNIIEDFDVTITSLKQENTEPKLLFYPCRTYEIYQRFGNPVEVHAELIASKQPLEKDYKLTSYSTISCQSNVVSTFIKFNPNEDTFNKYYPIVNKGCVGNCDYSYVTGEDALKTFLQTQSSSFTNQSVGKVVGSLLSVVGGAISLGLGTPLGAVAIGAGANQLGMTIGGVGAKYKDLENTPDKISNAGTSIYQDVGVLQGTNYFSEINFNPRIIITELSPSEKSALLDYFYHYGYNVQRHCVFNTELDCYSYGYKDKDWVDNRLITRKYFNYVKLNENLRTKMIDTYLLDGLAPVIADKLTNIFNNGITLWTLFNIETSNFSWNSVRPYFMKEDFENIENDY